MLLGTVVMLSVLCCLHMAACDRGEGNTNGLDRKYNDNNHMIRTVAALVLNPDGSNIFVQNGDTVHSSSKI